MFSSKTIIYMKGYDMRSLMFIVVAGVIMLGQGCGESAPQGAPIKIYPPGKGPDKEADKAPGKAK